MVLQSEMLKSQNIISFKVDTFLHDRGKGRLNSLAMTGAIDWLRAGEGSILAKTYQYQRPPWQTTSLSLAFSDEIVVPWLVSRNVEVTRFIIKKVTDASTSVKSLISSDLFRFCMVMFSVGNTCLCYFHHRVIW